MFNPKKLNTKTVNNKKYSYKPTKIHNILRHKKVFINFTTTY